ncbi:hypothetical protein COCVIDRAFT_86551 [Bipolaris victoriae FI3]|uniref:Uncharacterized protein n=1 Tax=Bipolaris victoriae (strain FI3) TaxID=930091 RepID=W7EUP4_BIPV3|nr:hypothetical protein COCVIDRAFT_86551 [Bipolaris victoriae FI3]
MWPNRSGSRWHGISHLESLRPQVWQVAVCQAPCTTRVGLSTGRLHVRSGP